MGETRWGPGVYGGRLTVDRETKAWNRHIAHIVGGTPELRSLARDMMRNALRNIARHRDTGRMMGALRMQREVSREGVPVDWVVVNTDPAAAKLEWGKGPHPKTPMWRAERTPGYHVMRNAMPGSPQARARLRPPKKKRRRK